MELLTLLFIGLKLTGYIHWSWWAVLAPEWVTVLGVAVLAVWFIRRVRKAERDIADIAGRKMW